jgi:TonB family protein
VKKIPILGDIPGIGFAFRSTSDNVTKSDLVILLTPHVVSGETPFTDFSEVLPREGAVAKFVEGKIIKESYSNISAQEKASREYNQMILERVEELAQLTSHAGKGSKGTVEVSFTLDSRGKLRSTPVIMATDNPRLNGIAIANIKDSAPFPPFPEAINKEEETFYLSLDYR